MIKRKITTAFLMFTIFILQSCKEADCNPEIYCLTPRNPFIFDLLDATTNENLFSNGTFDKGKIKVINRVTNTDEPFVYTYAYVSFPNLISLYTIGQKTEKITFDVKHDNRLLFSITVDTEVYEENCCTKRKYHEIKIENANYSLIEGYYLIYIP